jgi:hypothetical protein
MVGLNLRVAKFYSGRHQGIDWECVAQGALQFLELCGQVSAFIISNMVKIGLNVWNDW